MSNDGLEEILHLLLEGDDVKKMFATVQKSQILLVNTFSVYILTQALEHRDCKEEECNFAEGMPKAVDRFIHQLERAIRDHISINLQANGITLEKSHNEQVADELLKEINETTH